MTLTIENTYVFILNRPQHIILKKSQDALPVTEVTKGTEPDFVQLRTSLAQSLQHVLLALADAK